MESEDKIIARAVGGDRLAFGDLYDRYQPQIYRFAFLKMGRREDAEDGTHQVFMKAFQRISGYADRGHPFSSWLYEIARNQIVDHFRAAREEISLSKMDENVFAAPAEVSFTLDNKLEVAMARVADTGIW